ncbi:DUF4038 domain-containing protein [Rhizobium lentis]|uniref:DUF5060 domain-containing protein n=1 Tax=Rhizobium TaxID=379 RepID=UPI001C828283|nr:MULTISPECIES: DUF5060 domain-containing protein [Rhizobium]MBX5132375.1 DUF4038 domain-containing protein [Rhizobium lentis]MBX5213664.1 DUF4038 domain-containing protein [Rhizobium sp. NLR9a]MBX5219181.1 DUF4038 domain-containing protein [Rhizobium sp. NLR8a]MBX5275054.1 DUF4038 domain-containing protein [Rhizobium sp. NLR13a]MBX5281253.1 DUF4038 domain-containing protein [Rhizobium sp. NLR10a]
MTHLYDIFEARLKGPAGGNPYLDVTFHAHFSQGNRKVRVTGFHDGGEDYVLRFMPDTVGDWTFTTSSSVAELDGRSGSLTVTAAREGVHGAVRVRNRFHFAYDDGTSYYPFGTTCYAWTHQPLEMQERTLASLETSGFNKIRMAVFPKDYPFNTNDPLQPMFMEREDGSLDFDRPNPAAFTHLEKQIACLGEHGIEADLILFHPYDRWGYATMSEEQNLRYVEYAAARLSAFRNIWWALANEYDFLLDTIPVQTWDRFCHLLEENDHVQHLRSIHNGEQTMNFDHRKPWITHVCIQNWDVKRTPEWRVAYGKPVVNDEPEYEGNIWPSWGNITAQELVHRFWTTVLRGGYAGHGETYADPDDLIWWAKGGTLHGESWKRIKFLLQLLQQDQLEGLEPMGMNDQWPWSRISGARDLGGKVDFIYFGEHQPNQWTTGLPTEDGNYEIDLIDTWNMTVTPAKRIAAHIPHPQRHGNIVRGGKAEAAFGIQLPSRPNLALRIRKLD